MFGKYYKCETYIFTSESFETRNTFFMEERGEITFKLCGGWEMFELKLNLQWWFQEIWFNGMQFTLLHYYYYNWHVQWPLKEWKQVFFCLVEQKCVEV